MRVVQLFLKNQRRVSVACSELDLIRGRGIKGDCHAIAGSPRQVLFMNTATLQQFGLQPGELQENMLLEGAIDSFQSGQVWQIGTKARVRLTFLCEPCGHLEKIRPGLMRTIQKKRGFLGMVIRDGRVHWGDAMILTSEQFPALPETAKERFAEFVARIELGKVVRITDLVLALGVSRSYHRAIPALIRKANPNLPVHRLIASDGSLLTKYIPHQAEMLVAEGIEIDNHQALTKYCWQPQYFHDLAQ
jgi:MOSC domain-containing protein YiiM